MRHSAEARVVMTGHHQEGLLLSDCKHTVVLVLEAS